MKYFPINIASILLLFIIVITILIILIHPSNANAYQLNQKNGYPILSPNSQVSISPTVTSTHTSPNSPTPIEDERTQQLISEAQNDISAANTIIYWTGFIFAVIVGV